MGYFHKIMHSDIFVFLDDVQYESKGWQNRNRIKTPNGAAWLTVPVTASPSTLINEVKIAGSDPWQRIHKKTIMANYSKSEYFELWSEFEPLYGKKYELLVDVDMDIIRTFMKILRIDTKTVFSSELGVTTKKSDLNRDICRTLGADTYISGALGSNYLKLDDFKKHGIEVKFQHVEHPVYRQRFGEFLPNLSTLDLLFNMGPDSSNIIRDMPIKWK